MQAYISSRMIIVKLFPLKNHKLDRFKYSSFLLIYLRQLTILQIFVLIKHTNQFNAVRLNSFILNCEVNKEAL